MANEPPCWILDENHRDTGKRDYSQCNPICCTALCEDGNDWKQNAYFPDFQQWRPSIINERKRLLMLLRDISVQKAVTDIVSEKE